ncbi:MAG: hypothetical protein GF344_09615 [Chitinivibrionales bacterium]|nr:hypothetical protein [Chitinivibrionales bacterium]MBD3357099.1 hypothetical protein [Chitinivibrionales bacterium]
MNHRLAKGVRITAIGLSALFMANCASMVKMPDVKSVRKIGIVSIYMPTPEIKSKGGVKGIVDGVKNIKAGTDLNKVALQEIMISAVNSYESILGSMGHWEVVPLKSIVYDSIYKQALQPPKVDLGDSRLANSKAGKFAAKLGNAVVEGVASGGSFLQKPYDDMYCIQFDWVDTDAAALGEAAKKLGLDGIAVIKMELSHQLPKIAFTGPMGITKVYPIANQHMLVVDRKGSIVVDTRLKPLKSIKSDKKVPMLVGPKTGDNGYTFTDKDNEIVTYVNDTFSKSAVELKSALTAELIK